MLDACLSSVNNSAKQFVFESQEESLCYPFLCILFYVKTKGYPLGMLFFFIERKTKVKWETPM